MEQNNEAPPAPERRVVDIQASAAFGCAVCAHFGLDPVIASDLKVNCGMDEVLSVTITLAIDEKTIADIAARMRHDVVVLSLVNRRRRRMPL